jgi:uncharacterized repeat protein (TIGR01451 family)
MRPCLEALEDRLAPADLTITKMGPGAVAAGSNITYSVTVSNPTAATINGVTITDKLPTGLTLVSATPLATNPDTFAPANAGNTAGFTGSVGASKTDFFTIVATVGAGVTAGTTLANFASYTDPANPTPVNSATINTIVAPTGVALSKSGSGAVSPGGAATFTLTFTNTAATPVSTVTLSDALPTGLTLTSATPLVNPDNFTNTSSGNTASFTSGTVAAGSADTFRIIATASSTLANGTALADTATFTSTAGNGASNTVNTVVAPAGVALVKSGPAQVAPGGQVVYALTFSNTGTTAANTVSITDALPTGLTFVSAAQLSGTDTFTIPAPPTGTPTFTAATVAAGSLDVLQIVTSASSTLANATVLSDTANFTTANVGNGASNTVTTTVNAMVTITLTAPPSVTFSTGSQSFTVSATVAGAGISAPPGTVTFSVAGQSVTSTLVNGAAAAVLTLPGGQAAGNYTVTASFSGAPFVAIPATSPFVIVQSPTVVNITSVTDKFGFLSQTETVIAQVTGSNNLPANSGTVTLTNGGQSKTVSVSNGQATATFTFSILQELQTAYPHSITANFMDNKGNFLGSSVAFMAPGDPMGFFFQLAFDELLVLVLTGNLGVLTGQSSGGGNN